MYYVQFYENQIFLSFEATVLLTNYNAYVRTDTQCVLTRA